LILSCISCLHDVKGARCSTVAQEISRALVQAERVFGLHLPSRPYEPQAQTVKDSVAAYRDTLDLDLDLMILICELDLEFWN